MAMAAIAPVLWPYNFPSVCYSDSFEADNSQVRSAVHRNSPNVDPLHSFQVLSSQSATSCFQGCSRPGRSKPRSHCSGYSSSSASSREHRQDFPKRIEWQMSPSCPGVISTVESLCDRVSPKRLFFGTNKVFQRRIPFADSRTHSFRHHKQVFLSSKLCSTNSSPFCLEPYALSSTLQLSNSRTANTFGSSFFCQSSRVLRDASCNSIFSKWASVLGFKGANEKAAEEGGNKDEEDDEDGEHGKPPTIPPKPWELATEAAADDTTPYIPEVDDKASLKEEVLKELASKGATAVRVENVSKTFVTRAVGARQVVQNVSVNVDPGTMVALVGTSGSGKTTLMRMIAGLESATTGKIYFDGKDMTGTQVQDRDVGVMFQSYALFKHMTVRENIGYGLRTSKRQGQISEDKIAQRVNDLLDLVQLSDFGERYPPQLSGGQRQRVALARALATEPRVLLLDEPFGALDALVRKELRAWVRRLQQALRITTIFVTHDQDEALEMADLMIVFHRGKIIQMGPPLEVFQRPNSPFVMNFMCDPNIFPATSLAVRRSGLRTSKPQVLVRPDDAAIYLEERRERNTTPTTVTLVNNMGSEVELELTYDDGEKLEFVRQRYDWEDQPFEMGQRVHVQLKPLLLMPFSPEDLRP